MQIETLTTELLTQGREVKRLAKIAYSLPLSSREPAWNRYYEAKIKWDRMKTQRDTFALEGVFIPLENIPTPQKPETVFDKMRSER